MKKVTKEVSSTRTKHRKAERGQQRQQAWIEAKTRARDACLAALRRKPRAAPDLSEDQALTQRRNGLRLRTLVAAAVMALLVLGGLATPFIVVLNLRASCAAPSSVSKPGPSSQRTASWSV